MIPARDGVHAAHPDPARAEAASILEDVFAILHERRGMDFRGYRRATIERRLTNRMLAARTAAGPAYLALLRESENEIDLLAANFTIKVSRFYRNAHVFELLRELVIPDLRARFAGEALRAWSAGCAAGEEPYSLALLLADGERVFGTDLDEVALAKARSALYPNALLDEMPASLAGALAGPGLSGTFEVPDAIRRRVTFERHDLPGSAPPAGAPYHLILCRNVLIYFSRPLQRRAMAVLFESLVPGGVLCLGEAEWPGDELAQLEVVDRRARLFRRREAGR